MQVSFSAAVIKQALGAGFNALVSLVLVLWLARVMGVVGFGHYVAVLSGATVGLILLEGGWAAWVYRECASGRTHHEVIGHGLAHIVGAGALAVVVSWLVLPTTHAAQDWAAAWACMTAVAAMNLVSARMRGVGFFGWEALWQGAGRLVSALAIGGWVAVLTQPPDTAAVFAAWASGLCVVLVVGARYWLQRPRWRGLWRAYPRVLPFVLMALCMAWLLKGDMVLLSGWLWWDGAGLTPISLSYYAACTRLTEMGLLLFAPLGNVLLRAFVAEPTEVSDQARATRLLWRVQGLVWLVGAGAVGMAVWLGGEWMKSLFGAPYEPAGTLLPWVLLMLPAACGNWVWVQWWTACNAERRAAWCLLAAGVVLAAVTTAAAVVGGAVGAAIAVAVTHSALWVVFALTYLLGRVGV